MVTMKNEHEMLKEICNEIGFMQGKLECWDCMAKVGLQYSGKTKGKDGKCDKCGFEGKDIGLIRGGLESHFHYPSAIREIIFTQEFMDRYIGKIDLKLTLSDICKSTHYHKLDIFKNELFKNLDNPVQYLYNTLGLGNQ